MPITVRYDVPATVAGPASYSTGYNPQIARRMAELEQRAYAEAQRQKMMAEQQAIRDAADQKAAAAKAAADKAAKDQALDQAAIRQRQLDAARATGQLQSPGPFAPAENKAMQGWEAPDPYAETPDQKAQREQSFRLAALQREQDRQDALAKEAEAQDIRKMKAKAAEDRETYKQNKYAQQEIKDQTLAGEDKKLSDEEDRIRKIPEYYDKPELVNRMDEIERKRLGLRTRSAAQMKQEERQAGKLTTEQKMKVEEIVIARHANDEKPTSQEQLDAEVEAKIAKMEGREPGQAVPGQDMGVAAGVGDQQGLNSPVVQTMAKYLQIGIGGNPAQSQMALQRMKELAQVYPNYFRMFLQNLPAAQARSVARAMKG
jgi:hypothetical protein